MRERQDAGDELQERQDTSKTDASLLRYGRRIASCIPQSRRLRGPRCLALKGSWKPGAGYLEVCGCLSCTCCDCEQFGRFGLSLSWGLLVHLGANLGRSWGFLRCSRCLLGGLGASLEAGFGSLGTVLR